MRLSKIDRFSDSHAAWRTSLLPPSVGDSTSWRERTLARARVPGRDDSGMGLGQPNGHLLDATGTGDTTRLRV